MSTNILQPKAHAFPRSRQNKLIQTTKRREGPKCLMQKEMFAHIPRFEIQRVFEHKVFFLKNCSCGQPMQLLGSAKNVFFCLRKTKNSINTKHNYQFEPCATSASEQKSNAQEV